MCLACEDGMVVIDPRPGRKVLKSSWLPSPSATEPDESRGGTRSGAQTIAFVARRKVKQAAWAGWTRPAKTSSRRVT